MIILLLIVVWPFLCVLRTVLLIVIFSVLPQGVWEWKDVVCVLLPKPGSALNFLPDGKLVDDCWVGLDWIGWALVVVCVRERFLVFNHLLSHLPMTIVKAPSTDICVFSNI